MAKRKTVYLQPQQPKQKTAHEIAHEQAVKQAEMLLQQFNSDVPVSFLDSLHSKHLTNDAVQASRYFQNADFANKPQAVGYLTAQLRLKQYHNENKQQAQPSVDTQPQQQPAFSELGVDRFNKMIEGLGGREKTTPEQRAAIWQVAHSL